MPVHPYPQWPLFNRSVVAAFGCSLTLLDAADSLAALAGEDESYGNAIALLSIHSAISRADAVSIAYAERKSAEGDHTQAVTVLRAALGNRLPKREEGLLVSLIAAKDSVSYQGKFYPLADGQLMLEKARRFAAWADRMFQQRP